MGNDWGDCVVKGVPTLGCIPVLFQNVLTAALTFSGTVAIFIVVYAGIKLITSRGDPKQVEGAQHILTYAIVGLVLILVSFFIINIIATVTKVGCINSFGFDNCNK